MPSSPKEVQLPKDLRGSSRCGCMYVPPSPRLGALGGQEPCLFSSATLLLCLNTRRVPYMWKYEWINGRMYIRWAISIILRCHISNYHHLPLIRTWQRKHVRCPHWRNPLLDIERHDLGFLWDLIWSLEPLVADVTSNTLFFNLKILLLNFQGKVCYPPFKISPPQMITYSLVYEFILNDFWGSRWRVLSPATITKWNNTRRKINHMGLLEGNRTFPPGGFLMGGFICWNPGIEVPFSVECESVL